MECIGLDEDGQSLVPEDAAGLQHAQLVRAGYKHTCQVDVVGHILCWGRGSHGETKYTLANDVLPVRKFEEVQLGRSHTCALLSSSVVCFGSDRWGQTGVPESQETKIVVYLDVN